MKKDYSSISETAKHVSELRLDTDIPYSKEFYCPTELVISDVYRYFYTLYCEVRFKLITQIAVRLNPAVVIEFASGLSPRGLLLAQKYPDMYYIDSDLSGITKHKNMIFETTKIKKPKNLHFESLDLLNEEINFPLIDESDGVVVFITEGLLPYLNHEEIRLIHSKFKALKKKRPERKYYWVADLSVGFMGESGTEQDILKEITEIRKDIENKIDWGIISHPFVDTNHFLDVLGLNKEQVSFLYKDDLKDRISSVELLKYLLEDNIKSFAEELVKKKTTIAKVEIL